MIWWIAKRDSSDQGWRRTGLAGTAILRWRRTRTPNNQLKPNKDQIIMLAASGIGEIILSLLIVYDPPGVIVGVHSKAQVISPGPADAPRTGVSERV